MEFSIFRNLSAFAEPNLECGVVLKLPKCVNCLDRSEGTDMFVFPGGKSLLRNRIRRFQNVQPIFGTSK